MSTKLSDQRLQARVHGGLGLGVALLPCLGPADASPFSMVIKKADDSYWEGKNVKHFYAAGYQSDAPAAAEADAGNH